MKNYWKLDGFSLFMIPYVYVDHNSYLADSLFAQRKIIMKFKEEMARTDTPYCVIFCKVLKRDVQKFEEALEKLKDKMLLLGHKDYSDVCNEIEVLFDEKVKERK